jgi:hypothetical protein
MYVIKNRPWRSEINSENFRLRNMQIPKGICGLSQNRVRCGH